MLKDQVWKIIFFFHTNRPKLVFPDFYRLENYQKFCHTLQDTVEPCIALFHFSNVSYRCFSFNFALVTYVGLSCSENSGNWAKHAKQTRARPPGARGKILKRSWTKTLLNCKLPSAGFSSLFEPEVRGSVFDVL